jgi:hypothetical protein
MNAVGLELAPGEVVHFQGPGDELYALARAPESHDSAQLLNRGGGERPQLDSLPSWQGARELQTRQLALPSAREQSSQWPDGITIQNENGLWIARDRYADYKTIAWSSHRDVVLEVLERYVAEVRRQGRSQDLRQRLLKNRT